MQDGILIGEGVVLDSRPASFATRAVGALLDVLATVTLGFVTLVVVLGTTLDRLSAQWGNTLVIVLLVTFLVALPVTVETLSRGRSLGKLATGLRVVRDDGGPVRFRHALVRALVGVFELWLTFGSVAVITSLANARGKRLGDLLAGTYSVRVRGARGWERPLVMPPDLAAWAHSADIRRLPDGLALRARQVLDRAPRLAPSSRARLTDELAGQVEAHVAPGPPSGTPPEAFLHAVLHERRDRELVRGRAERERATHQAEVLHRLPYGVSDPRA
ncbi:putative RDD family membrane protein YckC [Isoptericola sp. CG 20/1183]|uniref:RDD family membrane protein YckC n=1 Tax=Isoptericola halotolerans TaxID=300560 RepID=A0ABX5EBN7_9MICO|nr:MULTISPECIES: RDD family protein [Isoptericola]MCK0118269.1 RDD family protein [Isoptericola sp. S6320L]PRZ04916.1 putative RDD family membrane protein YckC [Isoptericola halotolerans]PRZ05407.1 putative RDD family membrane protein YckC [Isoptericola sp. CG 20/1183]